MGGGRGPAGVAVCGAVGDDGVPPGGLVQGLGPGRGHLLDRSLQYAGVQALAGPVHLVPLAQRDLGLLDGDGLGEAVRGSLGPDTALAGKASAAAGQQRRGRRRKRTRSGAVDRILDTCLHVKVGALSGRNLK